ncbi:hypothetical protein CLAFUW4_05880 [Fulvia fulva]|uniref:SET domain-containing protein n=1 Tax=Passalora fulva TaxID=5499 RepID=A0A9Q8LH34_PASFU|nr:uncharacterized protein CLAFUR5_06024 [Fulvia fulva]KAK4623858.1 hypothetical protein CLAFUR4_05874 [Fulvia fulva]KAK4625884.1 hypothetical protein CLAFUR0_05887 [Fulvia fulva]UJO17268.1 hypothetical protein CLAFUR5_06024 [Fulvia fulva]WPV15215.1 hypothetical protein CLAFUW4_05880 [Fulvia fulva]WPV30162.1 hypothetical protein CLAFUW7_05878 [Fulvia fulva]
MQFPFAQYMVAAQSITVSQAEEYRRCLMFDKAFADVKARDMQQMWKAQDSLLKFEQGEALVEEDTTEVVSQFESGMLQALNDKIDTFRFDELVCPSDPSWPPEKFRTWLLRHDFSAQWYSALHTWIYTVSMSSISSPSRGVEGRDFLPQTLLPEVAIEYATAGIMDFRLHELRREGQRLRSSARLIQELAAWHALLPGKTVTTTSQTITPFWPSLLKYPTLLSIFRNNNFDIGTGHQALFGEICRINHDCVPNCQGNFNQNLDRFTIHSIQPIQQNEELTISYLSEHGALKESRQGRLRQQYGFLCDCPACDAKSPRGKVGEDKRVDLQEMLHEFAEDAEQRAGPSAEAELRMMVRMIEVYESEGIAGRELATMCMTAAEDCGEA